MSLPTVIFSYRVDDILEEVTKRTSKLGQMRQSEQTPFLVDRLSLTRGEDFMFSEFLEDAVSRTYDWVRAFGRNVPMYDKIVLKYDDIKITEQPSIDKPESDFPSIENPDFGEVELPSIGGGVEMTSVEQSSSMGEINPDVNAPGTDAPQVSPITKINRGTYVEYYPNPSIPDYYEVYQVNVDCTTANWKDYACKLAVDPRGCIVFILEHSCNMDMNLMSSIDRNLKEALVNFIIYKWFEYTNPQEADRFYLKFEAYGSEAKIGMDSEKKIRQRNYKLF